MPAAIVQSPKHLIFITKKGEEKYFLFREDDIIIYSTSSIT
jgi:hypothetical protein